MRAGGARRTSRRRVPSSAGRRGGGTASPRARRAARWLWGDGDESGERRVGGEGDLESTRGGEDAGAHARHMRRRTSGLRQLTLPPRPISRLSSASLPSFAASHTALPIESLIAPRFLGNYLVTPAIRGGRARLRGDAREGRRRANPSRRACSSPTGPSELGWPRQPWREGASRTLEATTARCRNAWPPRPLVWACEAAGEAGHPHRPRVG